MKRGIADRLWGMLGLLLIMGPALAEPTLVHGARLWSEPTQTRLVVDIAAPVEHQVFPLSDPDRVVVDISAARRGSASRAGGPRPPRAARRRRPR